MNCVNSIMMFQKVELVVIQNVKPIVLFGLLMDVVNNILLSLHCQ